MYAVWRAALYVVRRWGRGMVESLGKAHWIEERAQSRECVCEKRVLSRSKRMSCGGLVEGEEGILVQKAHAR